MGYYLPTLCIRTVVSHHTVYIVCKVQVKITHGSLACTFITMHESLSLREAGAHVLESWHQVVQH